MESYTNPASIRDIGESSDISSPGKAKKTKKDREPFYKGYGVMYLPGDINGLARKLHLLATEFFAGNTSVWNELVRVLDGLLRLKQLTRKEYADYRSFSSIIMIVYKRRRFAIRYEYGGSGIVDMIGSLLARYATKAMLTTAEKTAMRGISNTAKRAVPHLIAHKVANSISAAVDKK